MTAYYNENDPFAAAWLRELIKSDLIARGEVDDRSIEEVKPDDLRGFSQCHFFAGIGVWSYALRRAGWSDAARVWTGSCPCQSFSSSGKREGFSDKRHLWPAWFRLIRECKPDVCFGEQVASNDGLSWFDVVSSDMEGEGYTIGAADLCAAGYGAPHIRQRLYFVAESEGPRGRKLVGTVQRKTIERIREPQGQDQWWAFEQTGRVVDSSTVSNVAHAGRAEDDEQGNSRQAQPSGDRANDGLSRGSGQELRGPVAEPGSEQNKSTAAGGLHADVGGGSGTGSLVHSQRGRRERGPNFAHPSSERNGLVTEGSSAQLTSGFWRDAKWLYCRDKKYRPVEPGTFPLAHGATNRVGRLRGYGNALNAEVAKGFIEAYMSVALEATYQVREAATP